MAGNLVEPDIEFIRKLKKAGGEKLNRCYQCATCSVVCNLSPSEKPFPRKEMILAQWGQGDQLAKDPDIWLCYQCNDCSAHCPRGANPGDVLAAIRIYTYERYAFPSFMGKLVNNPKALPLLILVPMVLMLGIMRGIPEHDWKHVLEYLFIAGNVLIFIFAFIGLRRFWNALKKGNEAEQKLGFISSALLTVKDIISHGNFGKCQANKPRYYAHMLILFGFLGAMATAGLAAIGMKLHEPMGMKLLESMKALAFLGTMFPDSPIPMSHPIKWLGNLSGFAGFIGLSILVFRRLKGRDQVGANGYSDWLFLVMLYLVFITGLCTQFVRLSEAVLLIHSVYYVHLVFVFFLLWYAPYSKFAHMFYRTLALIHLRSIGRKAK